MQTYEIKVIAYIRCGFKDKFGIPRQSGLVDTQAVIEFESEYRNADALRGLEEYSHIWLLWQFSEAVREDWSPTVRPPRLGGNQRMGVFATRSPYRPNALGLSCVKLEKIIPSSPKGPLLYVTGADLMDGTPIFDIKPYLPFVDAHSEAIGGFAERKKGYALRVEFSENSLLTVSPEEGKIIEKLLSQDPRPSYQNDDKRLYGMTYQNKEIRFRVKDDVLRVEEIIDLTISG